jgi:hypothetical protein
VNQSKKNILLSAWTPFSDLFFRMNHWETWHWLAKYLPLVPAWLWYCLKSRSLWFFTSSNPTITFGGFDGESKWEMYQQLPPGSYPKSVYIKHSESFAAVESLFHINKFHYPVAVKPDVGRMGYMFRKIQNVKELQRYHARMNADYIIQEFVDYPIEVSVFYYRFPGQAKGTITGFVRKDYLQVIGDGRSTLLQLMNNYPRVRYRLDEMKAKHAQQLNTVIEENKIYRLSEALNLSRGGKLVSLEHEKDDRLLQLFDNLSHYAQHFYYGRYDVKCTSIEDLKAGKNYCILEYNGSGAEPHHIYGNGNSFWQAMKIVIHHWRVLYEISRLNKEKFGVNYWSFFKGMRQMMFAGKHFKKLRELDNDPNLLAIK